MEEAPPIFNKENAKAAAWIGALGVVYGDIGTSPIYTLGACLKVFPSIGAQEVIGVLSVIIWLLLLIVSLKYAVFITRADNKGEGGIFALLSLMKEKQWHIGFSTKILIFGAALLYGDGIITPAISVLSAVEGMKSIDPSLSPLVLPFSIAILGALFFVQSKGSGRIGSWFGPIMLVWFASLALLGLRAIFEAPIILSAFNPYWAFWLIYQHPCCVAPLLGGAVLAVTGAEALYADMGHFGRSSITKVWHILVMPSLVINYLGQGALVIAHMGDAGVISSPFFSLVNPGIQAAGLTVLSAIATVIASQAIITGAFSLTKQAIQLGFFPRLKILHTNAAVEGQIYIPFINSFLAVSVIAIVLFFRSSEALTQAYGTAVTGTMLISSFGFYQYCQQHWRMQVGRWPLFVFVVSFFLALDTILFGSNLIKFYEGGYIPICMGVAIYTLMYTWRKGRLLSTHYLFKNAVPIKDFLERIDPHFPVIPGIAVFMSVNPHIIPAALLHHIRCNKIYHQSIVLMTVVADDAPRAHLTPVIEELKPGIYSVLAHVGYMENMNVPHLLEKAIFQANLPWNISEVFYYFNHDFTVDCTCSGFWNWQKNFFSLLLRCSRPAYHYFKIPAAQIIETGTPIHL